MKAETRLSDFLLDLSRRFSRRGYSSREFNLSMSRQDIGNHLGIALETVSRLMTHFQQEGLLEVNQRRRITILDAAGLAVR
jgi:CRP/FNR family transcriptional regulator